jgi:hypothetical protein
VRHTAGRLRALRANPAVAITIDTESCPPEVLFVGGKARIDAADGVDPDYASAARRYLGEPQAEAYLAQIDPCRAALRSLRGSCRVRATGNDRQSRPPSGRESALSECPLGISDRLRVSWSHCASGWPPRQRHLRTPDPNQPD